MPIERLTAEDEIMLWPDEIWPQDIGAIALFDGANLFAADGRFRIEAVRGAVERKLHLAPRFRQLLRVPPAELGGPLWIDAPTFDIADHVRLLPLPPPGDEDQVLATVEVIRRRRLDRSKPLWEIWVLPGLPGNRIAVFMRTHHCIADGIAGVAVLGTLLDLEPDAATVPGPPWTPAKPPSDDDLRADHDMRHSRDMRGRVATFAHPLKSAHGVLGAWPAVRELLAEKELPASSLDRRVGPGRTLALVRADLQAVKDIAHGNDAKVNDVLLAAIAGGLRRLLAGRGEPVDGTILRVYVPVSLRHGEYAGARGNQIAQMVVPLPVGVGDPGVRLRMIVAETARRKLRARPSVGKLPHRGLAGRLFLKLIDRQHVNVTTADLPGPPVPLYLAGARLLEVFPLLPLIGRVSLGVGAISYAGQFNIAAVADWDSHPDLAVFASGVREELGTLELSRRRSAVA